MDGLHDGAVKGGTYEPGSYFRYRGACVFCHFGRSLAPATPGQFDGLGVGLFHPRAFVRLEGALDSHGRRAKTHRPGWHVSR